MCVILLAWSIAQHLHAFTIVHGQQRPGCNTLLNSCSTPAYRKLSGQGQNRCCTAFTSALTQCPWSQFRCT